MSRKNLPVIGLTVVLLACLGAVYLTRDTSGTGAPSKPAAARSQAVNIDQSLLQTAYRLAPLAETRDEQNLAGAAERLADHDLDQAFESALREAAAAKPPASGPIQQLTVRVTRAKGRIATDQNRVAKLTKVSASQDGAAKDSASKDSAAGQIELAKAQLALDLDELEDAQQDLAREGGDEHARLERALQEHEATHAAAQPVKPAATPESGAFAAGALMVWMALGNKNRQLQAAGQQAASKTAKLEREHQSLEGLLNKNAPPAAAVPASDDLSADDAGAEDMAAMTARLKGLSDQRKTLSELDRRIQDCQHLADTYKNWSGLIDTRRRTAMHQMLQSLSIIAGILLTVVLGGRALRHTFGKHQDLRRAHQLRFLATVGVQAVGLILILLVIFGPPSQVPTILGLAGAGMTVVLKDFIVAFFGWFVLMGRNGLHVGDWVEINGVGGEVVEIGLMRTVLLEMGNWTSTGHPTGRRAAFMNGYAIEGHYFNFSTANQWLWDELQVTLPPGGDPYGTAERIRQTVERATEAEAVEATQDWERVTSQYGTREFSAKPAVDLRPSVNGLEVFVRYITRAPQRYVVKSRLFQEIVPLLR
ncbi:MAG TPA: mechanosensitive ion channel domain-containing protein [Candidatus Acidoferrales bacterium]|jgi:small-conductance mechanosensitive channel|nr:mechanosensitive ion channel domain-containing protein [Candidatus Acidoferrales bacterium]